MISSTVLTGVIWLISSSLTMVSSTTKLRPDCRPTDTHRCNMLNIAKAAAEVTRYTSGYYYLTSDTTPNVQKPLSSIKQTYHAGQPTISQSTIDTDYADGQLLGDVLWWHCARYINQITGVLLVLLLALFYFKRTSRKINRAICPVMAAGVLQIIHTDLQLSQPGFGLDMVLYQSRMISTLYWHFLILSVHAPCTRYFYTLVAALLWALSTSSIFIVAKSTSQNAVPVDASITPIRQTVGADRLPPQAERAAVMLHSSKHSRTQPEAHHLVESSSTDYAIEADNSARNLGAAFISPRPKSAQARRVSCYRPIINQGAGQSTGIPLNRTVGFHPLLNQNVQLSEVSSQERWSVQVQRSSEGSPAPVLRSPPMVSPGLGTGACSTLDHTQYTVLSMCDFRDEAHWSSYPSLTSGARESMAESGLAAPPPSADEQDGNQENQIEISQSSHTPQHHEAEVNGLDVSSSSHCIPSRVVRQRSTQEDSTIDRSLAAARGVQSSATLVSTNGGTLACGMCYYLSVLCQPHLWIVCSYVIFLISSFGGLLLVSLTSIKDTPNLQSKVALMDAAPYWFLIPLTITTLLESATSVGDQPRNWHG